MSDISVKFCEDCGSKNNIEAKFCKSCGKVFPEIDDPRYQAALGSDTPNEEVQPPQYAPPGMNPYPPKNFPEAQKSGVPQEGQIPPPQGYYPNQGQVPPNQSQNQGQLYEQPPPGYAPNQNYRGAPVLAPTRVWTGKGLGDAINKLYRDPAKITPEILEDQNAPSPMILVVLIAFTRALAVFFRETKVIYTSIDVDEEYYSIYATKEGIQEAAVIAAITSFVLTFVVWWVFSWIMGKMIKGGLRRDSFVRYEATKSMTRFNAYRFVPIIFYNLVYIILIQNEADRHASVSMENTLGFDAPFPQITSDFSSFFVSTLLLIAIVAYLIAAMVFYRGIKGGLRHEGISPFFIAMMILLTPFFPGGTLQN